MQELSTIASTVMNIAAYSVLPVAVLALFRLRSANRTQRIVAWFIILSAICESLANYLAEHSIPNLWLSHVFSAVRFPLLAWLYRDYFSSRFLKSLIIIFLVLAVINSAFFENPKLGYNVNILVLESFLLLCLALGFLFNILKNLSIPNLDQSPLFWATLSIVFFFSGSFFIYTFNNYILEEEIPHRFFRGIYALILIIHYALFGVSLWIKAPSDELERVE